MNTVTLNNGVKMPILGFGVYQVTDPQECERSVSHALKVGYRLVDTAAAYENEEAVGRAIKKSDIARDELFITTKLWIQDAGYDSTKKAFERSLKRLQLKYLDLYLIHQPFNDIYGSWRAMEELYLEGQIKAIGVSNFLPDRLMDLMMNSKVVPAVNQIETHPFHQQKETQKFLTANGIQLESWGPFAQGHQDLFKSDILKDIAEKHTKTIAQTVLRWLIQRGVVAIPKSVSAKRIIENFQIFDFELSDKDMVAIAKLDRGVSSVVDFHNPETVKFLGSLKFRT